MNASTSIWSRLPLAMTAWRKGSDATLERLRQSWGKEITRERDFGLIALFHRFYPSNCRRVDDQTWNDLAMDEVFSRIDRTISMPGRQVLYQRLRMYVEDPAVLTERSRQHAVFRTNVDLREQSQRLLTHLDRSGAEYLAPLLFSAFPTTPRFAWLFHLLSAVPLACILLAFWIPQLLAAALLFVGLNTAIYMTYGQRIIPFFSGFAQIHSLLTVASGLARLTNNHALPELQSLQRAQPVTERVRRRLRWLVTDRTTTPELVQAVFGYLNMFFLLDVVIFLRSVAVLREHQAVLGTVMESVGAIDAAISVASYLEGSPICCVPVFAEQRRIEAVDLCHPLITAPVSNTFSLVNRSALIAGPNMAGKTSFMRTIGINLIFAQTLNFCLAREAALPRAVVRAAMRREDSLADGESYFFAEIKQILDFIRVEKTEALHVFLIDEIFRGTNTIERIASSVAVLRHLAKDHMVLVTTHDSQLQQLLADTFDMHHFTDRVTEGSYGFDYVIRPGPVRSRNAIKLLELTGYPTSITAEAEGLAEELSGPLP
jgi:hypothetical protein